MLLRTLFFLLHFFHSPPKCPRPQEFLCILLLCCSASSIAAGAELDKVPCDASFIGLPTSTSPHPDSHPLPLLQQQRQQRGGAGDDPGVGINPPYLEWGDKPVLQPAAITLTITNQCNTSSLTIFPPRSTNSQFYVPGVAGELRVQPGEEHHLRVVFLPRVAASMQGVLVIHTSSGGFLVHLQGRGIPSPFKLQPPPRLDLLPGETRRESIALHNPYPGKMTLREVRLWSDNRTLLLTNPINDRVGVVTRCCNSDDEESQQVSISVSPGGPWEAGPGEILRAAEVELRAAGSGVVYVLLYVVNGSGDGGGEQVVVPINVRGSPAAPGLQAVPEVVDFGLLGGRKVVRRQGIYLVNAGAEAVEIDRVSRSSGGGGGGDLVAVRYRKGVVIGAGSRGGVQVAVAWYRGVEGSVCLDKKLDSFVFHTNSSGPDKLLHVPYRALVGHTSGDCHEEVIAEEDEENRVEVVNHVTSGLQLHLSLFEELERRLFTSSSSASGGSVFVPSGEFEIVPERNEISLRASSRPLFPGSSLEFSAVEVGSEGLMWVSLTNPGDTPIAVKLLVGEHADCKSSSSSGECGSSPGVFSLGEDGERLLGASETAVFGPVFFRPAQRCAWTGLLAVKNTLTSVEWIPLQGIGSFAELSFVDESMGLPLESLELSGAAGGSGEHLSTITTGVDENLSRLSEGLRSASCNRRMNGSLVAKNTGDAPLKVHSVRLVNGRCSWQGFELASCQENFWLAAGESAELKVSYRPDFGSPRVRQDLRLVTSIGTVNFPVLVVLPDHMLRLCATIPFYFKYKKVMVLAGLLALIFLLLFLPAKLSGSKDGDLAGCDPGSTSSLPFFREEAFSPLVSEDSSSKLSKIQVAPGEINKQQQQQHSIVVSSPVSSPRKSSKSHVDRTKRKKKKAQGPLCSVKVQDKSSCSSPTSSAPVSPAISSVSPPTSRLDVETGPGSSAASPRETQPGESSSSNLDGEWVTVDRKSLDRSGGERKRGGLTQSASFPSRSSSSSKGGQAPSDRAPGSKLSKNSSSSSLANEQDSCSERSNSGRFCPGDVIVEQADDCRPSSLVYDIWGDHFAEISRQPMKMSGGGGDGAESLFAYSVLKHNLQQDDYYEQQQEQGSNFSMFSGSGFMREVDEEEQLQQQQALSPAHFLVSPFDLSYRFPHTPSV